MIVLDASILIAHLDAGHPRAADAFAILDTEEELAIHPLTLAEVLVHPARSGQDGPVIELIERLGIDQVPSTVDEPVLLARLRADSTLKMPDCCVVVAAERTGAALATFDTRLAATARDRGITVVDPTS